MFTNRNLIIFLLTLCFLISACSSSSAYKPAIGNGYGYSESQISEDRYQVQFRLPGEKRMKAMDYVLLRAAELTLEQGYDWFLVIDRETMIERSDKSLHTGTGTRTVVTQDCGLLTCNTHAHRVRENQLGLQVGSRGETDIVIEVRLGKGLRPEDGSSYDAVELRERLEPKEND